MLTQNLKTLQKAGMITRKATASVPPRVDYTLTPLAISYLEHLEGILQWSLKNRKDIEANQAAYDAASNAKDAA